MARIRILRTRLGLRARITLAFTLVAAVLSLLLAGTTWALTRSDLVDQREASLTSKAVFNARFMRSQIPENRDAGAVGDRLGTLENPAGSRSLIELRQRNGRSVWVAQTAQYGENALPVSLKRLVARGTAARMRYTYQGETELAIGIPIPDRRASYFEIVSMADLESTLDSLAVSLLGATLLTTLAGAGLGYWAARRTLRPLTTVGSAAEAIAGGHLDTRLDGIEDRDLEPLVSSFNRMARALEDRIDSDNRFASDVSHELRSPLMTLAASIQVLAARRDEMPDDAARSAVDLMEADVARFQQLVDDLLEISRFDAGVARLALDEVHLPELVRQAVETSSEEPVLVLVEDGVDDLVVRADKRRLVRVIANLLDNARKYGGGATSVRVQRPDADRVHIAVEDAGPGIPPEERTLVFDRFARGRTAGHRSSASDGVGLGLSLVSEHVGLHGGRTWVEDRPDGGAGARFVVELPVGRP
ncbi:MAG: HAMP domain-containing histidine kinase [Actinobacteria bacterium]|nr:HAMP domain-containing histidine kinase [Actinomycetota bacterium]